MPDTMTRPLDSLKGLLPVHSCVENIAQPSNVAEKIRSKADSIKSSITQPLVSLHNSMDSSLISIQTSLANGFDSAWLRVSKPVSDVASNIETIQSNGEQKIATLTEKGEQQTDKLQHSVGFSNATNGNVVSPLGDANASHLNITKDLPGIQGPDISSTSGLDVEKNIPDMNFPNAPEASLDIGSLKENISLDVPDVGKVSDIKSKAGELGAKTGELEKYKKQIGDLKRPDSLTVDNAVQFIEEKASSLEEVKAIQTQQQLLTKQQVEYNNLVQKSGDPKLLREEILRKSRNVVTSKINHLTPAFKEAQEQIAKAKKVTSTADRYKDGIPKRHNEMNDLSFRERLVPGITLQVYKSKVFTMDWGVQLGYRITNRLQAGVGGIYRIGVSEKYSSWVRQERIYGYRISTSFDAIKGFYLHGEMESLHCPPYMNMQTQLEVKSQQVYSGYFGIGRRYSISKRIRGAALVLYRAEMKGDLPSMSKLNLRIGFDYSFKKK